MNVSSSGKGFSVSLFVNNKPGVLVRIAQTFARRGYNIDSLVVSNAHDARYSRITVVFQGDHENVDQILRQLNNLLMWFTQFSMAVKPLWTERWLYSKSESNLKKGPRYFKSSMCFVQKPSISPMNPSSSRPPEVPARSMHWNEC